MKTLLTLSTALLIFGGSVNLFAHCQVPCGIYHDKTETTKVYEDIGTVEKCMTEITRLSAEQKPNYNQIVRWVNTKEEHATRIQQSIWQYFMMQRVAPVAADNAQYPEYVKKLTTLHSLLVDAMKCKQGTDPAVPKRMRETLKTFEKLYPPAAIDHHHH